MADNLNLTSVTADVLYTEDIGTDALSLTSVTADVLYFKTRVLWMRVPDTYTAIRAYVPNVATGYHLNLGE